jgi:hypothetical protein
MHCLTLFDPPLSNSKSSTSPSSGLHQPSLELRARPRAHLSQGRSALTPTPSCAWRSASVSGEPRNTCRSEASGNRT